MPLRRSWCDRKPAPQRSRCRSVLLQGKPGETVLMPFRSTTAPAKLPDRVRGGVAALVRRRLGLGMDDMLEPSIYRFVLRYSLPEQVYLVVVTLLSFPFLYLSLDLPKQIINEAIGGKHFPREFFGFELGQIAYLVLLCL